MLARLALQAPRLGFTAARLATSARPVGRVAPIAASQWARTYAKSKGNPNRPSANPNNSNASKQPSSSESVPEGSSSPVNASSAESETAAAKDSSKAAESNADEPHIPFDKLPDLTQGIPSTLDAEIEQKYGKTRDPSALQTVDDQGSGRGRGGGREEYVSSSERNRKWWARFFLAAVGGGSVVGIAYLGRNWESEEEAKKHPEIPNGWSPILWYQRVKARFDESVSYYQDPAFEKLLPDPDPVYGRPYTLVLSLDDLLIHSEWTREHGWRVAKRPGVDYFIRYLHLYYELALFTTVPYAMAEGVLRKLDPHHFIQYPLFREATKFEDGEIVKDLSYLNRDLSKVIIIDTDPKNVRKQPENAIVLNPWKGNPNDKDLVSLIPFLEYIAAVETADVRKVIKSFEGKDIPTEFARREAIARKEFNKRLEAAKKSKPSGIGALSNMLGLTSSSVGFRPTLEGEQDHGEAFAQGKMIQDIARERGQRYYEMLEKDLRENGEKYLKEEQAFNEKQQKEAMDSMFGSFSSWFVPKSDSPKKE